MIHFPGIPVLGFARDDKGEESKEEQLLFLWGYPVVKGLYQQKCMVFVPFRETPCSCHYQSN